MDIAYTRPATAPASLVYPSYIFDRLLRLFNKPPRFENSFYGPINLILYTIFPPDRNFIVKPQPVLQPTLPLESSTLLPEPDPSSSNRSSDRLISIAEKTRGHNPSLSCESLISFDSYGDTVLPREQGSVRGWLVPDFLVVKAGKDTHDVNLAMLEIKRYIENEVAAVAQVWLYLDAIQSKAYPDRFLALLCLGEKPVVWETRETGDNARQVMRQTAIQTGGTEFCQLLVSCGEA